MKNLITAVALALTVSTVAFAADEKPQAGMMQGEMMKNCQSHMKDGKMMDNMPKDMMGNCQEMIKNCQNHMKNGMMMDIMSKEFKNECQEMIKDGMKR